MSRRIGRTRIFQLNTQGRESTRTAEVGIADSIARQTELRDGTLITTDFQIDLGNSTAPAKSTATAGLPGASSTVAVIGVSSSLRPENLSQLMAVDKTRNGVLVQAELVCVEPPATGEDNIGLWYADTTGSSGMTMNTATNPVQLIPAEVFAAAGDIAVVDDISADINGKFLYLVSSGSTTGIYSAGKFVLRLHGYDVFDDV